MWLVIRVTILYTFLLLAMRGLGKREFAQLSAQEVILLLLVSETLQQAMVGDDFSMTAGIIASSTLMLCSFATSMLSYRFKKVETALGGTPAVLVADGQLLRRNLDIERVSSDEIFAAMRRVGIESIEQVKWALLETDGHISVIPVAGSELRPEEKN
ncbi:MAG: YetF domain-containing protein, partial [Longimicrobiales bacterium]